jgi:cyanophycinase
MMRNLFQNLVLLTFFLAGTRLQAEEPTRIRPDGVEGSVLLWDQESPAAARDRLLQLAGARKAKVVLLTVEDNEGAAALKAWKEIKSRSVMTVTVASRKQADSPSTFGPLREATGVVLLGEAGVLVERLVGTLAAKELNAVLSRGGVVGGNFALAKRIVPVGAKSAEGLGLLPGSAVGGVAAHEQKRILDVLKQQPTLFGLALEEGAALLVTGRRAETVGIGKAVMLLAANATLATRITELPAGTMADFTVWRRAALSRTLPPYPPEKPGVPEVKKGSLVVVGGATVPDAVAKRFVELAGGPDALIVFLPTAQLGAQPSEDGFKLTLRQAGARNVKILSATEQKDVEDPKNLELLRQAGGIWFDGGRQHRYVEVYEGTKAEPLFHEVLRRGGVIGGTSAGASIQGDFLVRGNPRDYERDVPEGYERALNFLPGTLIDQHFSARWRYSYLSRYARNYPQMLGIGIDESTAIIVQGHIADVMGEGKVHFYDGYRKVKKGEDEYEAVTNGGRYDLKARRILPR